MGSECGARFGPRTASGARAGSRGVLGHQVEKLFLNDLAVFRRVEPNFRHLHALAGLFGSDVHIEADDELVVAVADEGALRYRRVDLMVLEPPLPLASDGVDSLHARRPRRLRLSAPVVVASLVAFCVSSCTVGPDYVLPASTVPDAWQLAVVAELEEEAPHFSTWWVSLDDPILTELIERSIDSNLSLQIAAARVAESRALLGVATGNYYPIGSLEASYSRLQQSDNGVLGPVAPEGGFSANSQYDIGLGFNWEIDVFGRVGRGVEAASAQLSASIEDYRDVLVVLVADVASNYVAIRTTQARIDFAVFNVVAQEESLRLTQDRFNAGLTSARDVAQAESNLANTRAAIPSLEINLESAINRLAVLLGKPPGAVDELFLEPTPIPTGDPLVSTGPPAELLRRRPDIRRAERDLAAQTARIGVATADLYPSFSLQGFLGLQSTSGGDLFESSCPVSGPSSPAEQHPCVGGF